MFYFYIYMDRFFLIDIGCEDICVLSKYLLKGVLRVKFFLLEVIFCDDLNLFGGKRFF